MCLPQTSTLTMRQAVVIVRIGEERYVYTKHWSTAVMNCIWISQKNMSTDDDCSSRYGVIPAVIMSPTLQEEIIFCHEQTSSESSVVTTPNCVEEEDEGGRF